MDRVSSKVSPGTGAVSSASGDAKASPFPYSSVRTPLLAGDDKYAPEGPSRGGGGLLSLGLGATEEGGDNDDRVDGDEEEADEDTLLGNASLSEAYHRRQQAIEVRHRQLQQSTALTSFL